MPLPHGDERNHRPGGEKPENPGQCVSHYSGFWKKRYEARFADPHADVYVADNDFPEEDATSYIRLLHQCGIVLCGAPIADTFAQVSDADFWVAISADAADHGFDRYESRYFASNILILGRILSFKAERRILSKYEAGLWMIRHVPEHLKSIPRDAMAVWYDGEERELDLQVLEDLKNYLTRQIMV